MPIRNNKIIIIDDAGMGKIILVDKLSRKLKKKGF